jgi:ABC-2 type transport system permease protein
MKFGEILQENYINIIPMSLAGDQDTPPDCDLLIIAGPHTFFSDAELNRIDHYLSQGGRLLVLLDYNSINHPTGLENFLAQWDVNVGMDVVQDGNTSEGNSFDVIVEDFSAHPVVNSLTQSKLELILPRPVAPINTPNPPADAPTVTVLAQSSPHSILYGQHGVNPCPFPLMVAVEQNSAKGLANPNGGMRMVVVGESMFLDNQIIELGENRDFASYAVNWLLDRPTLLTGIGPSPVTEFRLLMTQTQVRNVRWLLLGALPGIVLVFGWLVWLRRRK